MDIRKAFKISSIRCAFDFSAKPIGGGGQQFSTKQFESSEGINLQTAQKSKCLPLHVINYE